MRRINYNFLLVIGLMLTLGLTSAYGFGDEKNNKKNKDMGILTVKTDEPMTVFVDGAEVGKSGVGTEAVFYVTPGNHDVKVVSSAGNSFSNSYTFEKGRKQCICLKTVKTETKRPCPYDISVSGPERVMEGDLITFAAFNNVTGSTTPLNYRWKVSPDSVRITSGLGTSAITVDTTGMGGQRITAELDVTDDIYGKTCMQKNSVPTEVDKKPEIKSYKCDEFVPGPFDDAKARFDNCVLQLQGSPDSQLYIIIYEGTDKISMTRNSYDKLSKRTLDYLVKTRGFDPRRISIVKGNSMRQKTTFEIWIVPPGAQLPVPQ